MPAPKTNRLKKQLSLFDIYVISTGAMFSSGFFLLPGLAAAHTGPSVVLAYFLSALLIVPAMLSQAELATAMPRAGGAYYFLDRTLGPLVGTVGGIGTWVALMLKSAFALIGMGVYLALIVDVPVKPLAVGFTIVFAVLNIVGAKESSGVLRILVIVLLAILGFFLLHGLFAVASIGPAETALRFTPFMPEGVDGLLGTVGLVFVSYVGLTQVASVAEEIKDPDRTIPLGMTLSLATVSGIYVLGVFIMVAVLGAGPLSSSLTPVADAAENFLTWVPRRVGVLLIVVAAVSAFASMSNAGIMAASRYPLAMARDHLLPEPFARVGRSGTPIPAIVLTSALLIAFLLILNVEQVAKLASALQLLIFALVNVAVLIMRESRIDAYDPGFSSPLYPWLQIVGALAPFILVAEMGWLPVLFTLGVMSASLVWYFRYARDRIGRDGAIYHVFERLGRRRFAGLDQELRDIMKEKGLREQDPFDEVVARAFVLDAKDGGSLEKVIESASTLLQERVQVSREHLTEGFGRGVRMGGTPVSHGAVLLHTRLPALESSELVLVRCTGGLQIPDEGEDIARHAANTPIQAVFFLVSGEADPGRHLRILAQLAARVEDEAFITHWLAGRGEQDLKETLLRDDRFLAVHIQRGTDRAQLIGLALRDLRMPKGSLVALVRRVDGHTIVPRGSTVLRDGDQLTIIGEPRGLKELAGRFSIEWP